ncbi:MAG: hypothetical protein P3X24_004425, partial [bacterium]|nr:hypothetical protein [bacterium]
MLAIGDAYRAFQQEVQAHPAFTLRFWDELRSRELRVPLTKDPALFQEACKVGAYLLWLHTYG